jgi:hypothetical protein
VRAALILPLSLALAACASGSPFRCDLPTSNPWRTQAPEGFRRLPPIEAWRIQPLPETHVPEAVARLSDRSVSALTPEEAAELTGAARPAGTEALRPWLVRAVYPAANAAIGAAWLDGDRLVVTADGMGCAPFVQHPVLLWLEREPMQLFVVADAVL